jgi:Raf kinase inhibitor-like YbhB/YbcL family protein
VPGDGVSLALIVDDPDAPSGTFTHSLVWGIDPDAGRLAEREPALREVRNDFGEVGYRAPCPPPGGRGQRYFFRLFALGNELAVAFGSDLQCAIDGSEVAELVGIDRR